jgi:hypothetical protein
MLATRATITQYPLASRRAVAGAEEVDELVGVVAFGTVPLM